MRVALTAACTLFAAPGAARGEPIFDAFEKTCLATAASAERALAVADELKWQPLTQAQLASLPLPQGGMKVEHVQGRLSPSPPMALVVARMASLEKDVTVAGRVCAIAAPGGDAVGLQAAAAGYAKVPAVKDGDTVAFAWREGPNGRLGLNADEFEKAKSNAGVTAIALGSASNMTIIFLLAPEMSPP